jgi:hypothetical protein
VAWECFLLERTDEFRESLRRFVLSNDGGACAAHPLGYHNAEVEIGTATLPDCVWEGIAKDDWPHDDARWPSVCTCGRTFTARDRHQHRYERLYRDSRSGKLYPLREAPVGAMWFVTWPSPDQWSTYYEMQGRGYRLPLVLMTPAGEWWMDIPASNGPGWQVTGEVPRVTARPSIHIPGRYHGWLTEGQLSNDIDGRVLS